MKPSVSVIIPVYNVEKYIERMLESVRNQTFQQWEAILINDGSTDSSQLIIDKFTKKDKRFRSFYKENGGVASARNMGIDLSEGDYLVFYDPDDFIPPKALQHMHNRAISSQADMIVGVMEEISLGEHLIYMHSQKLAKQKKISSLDKHFFGAWSICNKMFSADFVKSNNLKIEPLTNAEDGVFTFSALKAGARAAGCDHVAYNYLKRPFWTEPSATQNISPKYLKGLLASHDRILELAKSLNSSPAYLEDLYIRFMEGEMINGYYRGLWRAGADGADMLEEIKERYNAYSLNVSAVRLKELYARHRDIKLEEGFKPLDYIQENPKISVIISPRLNEIEINRVIGSLYNQRFLYFEILISSGASELVDDTYLKRGNMKVFESKENYLQQGINKAKGEFIVIVNEAVIYTKESLRAMEGALYRNRKLDFAAMNVKLFDGNETKPIAGLNGAFGYFGKGKGGKSNLNLGDALIANKLIRKASLSGITLTGDSKEDSRRLYEQKSFIKLRKGAMVMENNASALPNAEKSISMTLKISSVLNSNIEATVNKLKRVITREDINNFKNIFKKKGK